MLDMGPTQLNIPRDYFYGDYEFEIPEPIRVERGPGGSRSLGQAAELLGSAKFPVIVAGGGVVMSNGIEACTALAELLGAAVVTSYLHNDSFPASHPLWCGPLGYQGSKAGMQLISQADVVLALGTRLVRSAPCRSTGSTTGRRTRRSSRSTRIRRCWAS